MKHQGLSIVVFTAVSLTATANGADRKPNVLNPNAPWTLDYADERCSLVRPFGSGGETVRLRIDSYGSYSSVRFFLTGKPIPKFGKSFDTISYRFDSDPAERQDVTAMLGTAGNLPAASFNGSFASYDPPEKKGDLSAADIVKRQAIPNPATTDLGANIHSMTVDFAGRTTIELRFEAMSAPLKALRDCVDDLYRSWGLDAAMQKTLTRLAAPKIPTVQKLQGNFPSALMMNGTSAFVPVRIMVDETGTATACVVQISNIDEEFKHAVCNNLARRFDPALDQAGHPVASVYQTAAVFMNGL